MVRSYIVDYEGYLRVKGNVLKFIPFFSKDFLANVDNEFLLKGQIITRKQFEILISQTFNEIYFASEKQREEYEHLFLFPFEAKSTKNFIIEANSLVCIPLDKKGKRFLLLYFF